MATLWRKVMEVYRRGGPSHVLARAAALIYARHTELVFAKNLHGTLAAPGALDGLRIRPVTRHDVGLLAHFNAKYRSKKKVIASTCYVKNGYEAFLAFRHDELIGYWWWVTRDTAPRVTHPSLERFGLTLKYDELFAFDFFIAPEHRVNGTAVKFLSLIYEELVRAGYRVVWGSVDASNMRARWVYNVLGNKVAWRNTAYELFGYVLLQDRRIFVRNTRWATPHSFDRRLLFRLAPRAAGPLTDPASLSESATSART